MLDDSRNKKNLKYEVPDGKMRLPGLFLSLNWQVLCSPNSTCSTDTQNTFALHFTNIRGAKVRAWETCHLCPKRTVFEKFSVQL